MLVWNFEREYNPGANIQPGVKPSFLRRRKRRTSWSSGDNEAHEVEGGGQQSEGNGDKGFRYFGGIMGETEAAMLLSDKGIGAFMVRLRPGGNNEGKLVISYVGEVRQSEGGEGWVEDTEELSSKGHKRNRTMRLLGLKKKEEGRVNARQGNILLFL